MTAYTKPSEQGAIESVLANEERKAASLQKDLLDATFSPLSLES